MARARRALVRHCVERYGRAEVESWYWEVWNEPNIGYWQGTPEEWYQLYDYAVDGVRRALPTARVGGPHTAGSGGAFMDGFLRHVVGGANAATGGTGAPADFLAFHAKGQPAFVDGHVRMGIGAQLRTLDEGFRKIAAGPGAARTGRSSSASPIPTAAPPARARSSATATARCMRATPPRASPGTCSSPTATA